MEKSMMQGGFSIGAAGSGNVLDAGGKDPLGVDAEGEESIASRLASDLVL